MASHQSPSERGMAGEEVPGGAEGRSEQSGSCLHWLQSVDPDSNDVSPVCIRYTDVGVDALLCLREETGDGNGQVSNRRGKAHVMHCCVCLLGDTYGYVVVCFHLQTLFLITVFQNSRGIPES